MGEGTQPIEAIWGARAIAAELGITYRAAFKRLELGQIPARKVGGSWVADRARLRAFIATPTNGHKSGGNGEAA